jgi:hypothetical protein
MRRVNISFLGHLDTIKLNLVCQVNPEIALPKLVCQTYSYSEDTRKQQLSKIYHCGLIRPLFCRSHKVG